MQEHLEGSHIKYEVQTSEQHDRPCSSCSFECSLADFAGISVLALFALLAVLAALAFCGCCVGLLCTLLACRLALVNETAP